MSKTKTSKWTEKIANSNGTMLEVPKKMKKEAEKFQEESQKYIQKAKEFDRINAEFDVYAKNFWHKMRKSLEDNGVEDIWGKNIGFNEEAKKEGKHIINIMPGGQGGMQMR